VCPGCSRNQKECLAPIVGESAMLILHASPAHYVAVSNRDMVDWSGVSFFVDKNSG